jgi:CubicO group peptidase (beta-lactamase class C family)
MMIAGFWRWIALGLLMPLSSLGPTDSPPGRPEYSFQTVDSAVASGVIQGVYPGAVVIIGRSTGILHSRGFGHLAPGSSSSVPNPDSTLFDLASLTKVVATTSAAMLLVDRGRLDLDAPVRRYLPEFRRPEQRAITIRMLLNHTSGLRPSGVYFRRASSRKRAIALVLQEKPERAPGTSAVYSDINAILMGLVVERISGKTLNTFTRDELYTPLGMGATRFLPPVAWRGRIAASFERRGHPVSGTVQDMNARVLGGIAGHAGLFATGADLARFAEWWLAGGRGPDGSQLVAPRTMALFLEHQPGAGTRLLGWDSPDPAAEEPTLFGTLLSGGAYGHTGWTGTQIWVDPEQDLFVILLTNRSMNPDVYRSLRDLRAIRARVADEAVIAIEPQCFAHPGLSFRRIGTRGPAC